jgi:CheY-like chemotaxis protein
LGDQVLGGLVLTDRRKPRDRRLVGDEEQRLLARLKAYGAYFSPLAELAIESAMYQRELLALTPADVDLEHRLIHVRQGHTGEPRTVPLSARAEKIISALPRPVSLVAPLFPISRDELIRVFRRACKDAGIHDLTFQDLRHEAIARICERLPMQEAMRITGHKTPAMLVRYYPSAPPLSPSPSNRELPPLAAQKNLRILVVEDNRDGAQMLVQFLKLSGYSVAVAYSSREGLESAKQTPPDVVLCDIGLPDADGYALAAALRREPKTARARLIAVTARSGEQDRQRSREAGFQLHLVKPVNPEKLIEELDRPAKKAK